MATLTKELSQKELTPLEVDLLSCLIDWPRPHGSHTNQHKSYRPFSNEFEAPVTTDLVPPGSVCDWCDQTAERRLTVIGGSWHDKTGAFCSSCGQRFVEKVVNA